MSKINIQETSAKTILVKSKLPKVDYVINPYTGCLHACHYCYANYMKKFTQHTEPWGKFVDVKINAPQILRQQMKHIQPCSIMMSSVTDPYNQAEKKYKLSRQILEILLPYQWPIHILTKSDLITRDIDLLQQFKNLRVGFSFFTYKGEDVKNFEACTPPPQRRIAALQKLDKHDIRTYAFLAPILPHITDLEPLFKALASTGIGFVYCDKFNHKTGQREQVIINIIKDKYPDLWLKFWKDYQNKQYWHKTAQNIKKLAKMYNIPATIFFGFKT